MCARRLFFLVIGIVGAGTLLGAMSLRRFKLVGRRLKIEEISSEGGSMLFTTIGPHCLRYLGGCQIPVTLEATGHFLLDSNPTSKKVIVHKVRVKGPDRLEILDQAGNSFGVRADSSMGVLQMSALDSLIHKNIHPRIRLPAGPVGLGLMASGWVLSFILRTLLHKSQDGPEGEDALIAFVTFFLSVLFASVTTAIARLSDKTKNSLADRMAKFDLKLNRPNPQPCKRGPDRAVTAFQLFDFYEYFCSFIRDRTMYYIDPNIVRPLTAACRLSFAERIGPNRVKWFISHWWGTEFQNSCSAIRKHAQSVCNPDNPDEWKQISYWICTFSNNQYQVSEELCSNHKESSFYLALHSQECCGTYMILDEKATPLTRSWCLFELLQTLRLEATKQGHSGLLFGTTSGVLNGGSATVEMALQIGNRIAGLSLKDAEAITDKDKDMINSLVLKEMGSFEAIDAELREHLKAALQNCQTK